jgi:hypothetical protein
MVLDRIEIVETGGIAFYLFGRPGGAGGIEMIDP